MLTSACLLFVGAAQVGGIGRVEAILEKTSAGTVLSISGREPIHVAPTFSTILVAPGGRRVLLHESPMGALAYVRPGQSGLVDVAKAARSPQWAADGAHVIFLNREGGLSGFNASLPLEAPQVLVPRGVRSACFAPDSMRVAYAQDDGVWIAGVDGANRRRIVRNRTATAIAWHPDGRTIAFVEPGLGGQTGRLYTVRATGTDLKAVGPLVAQNLSYSPNGQHLLVGATPKFSVAPATGGVSSPLPASLGTPTWIGAQKLVLTTTSSVAAYDVVARQETALRPRGEGWQAYAVDPQPELSASMLFPNPFRGAAPPSRGQIRVEGLLTQANPLDGEFVVAVMAVVDSSGRETRLSRPLDQPISVGPEARLTDGRNTRPLRMIDLQPDGEVALWLRAPALDSLSRIAVDQCWTETATLGGAQPLMAAPRLRGDAVDYDGVSRELVSVPLVFPVAGRTRWSDSFLADRAGGRRRHHGQDLMAAKMTPLVACFDGVVHLGRGGAGGHYTIRLRGDNGWIANYYHVNNDTPGTDDGLGGDAYAFAPGLESGQRVFAGQFIGYVGDSGNAEGTAPHLHFELWDGVTSAVVNAAPSLRVSQKLDSPTARVADPTLKPMQGEVRLDGTIASIDVPRKVVRVSLLARTEKGKTRAVTGNASVYVAWKGSIDAHLLGNESIPVDFADLRPGLYAACIGQAPSKGKAMTPRRVAFATP